MRSYKVGIPDETKPYSHCGNHASVYAGSEQVPQISWRVSLLMWSAPR